MATTPTRSRGNKDTAPQQQQQQRQDPPKSPSSSAKDRKVLSRKILPLPAPRRRVAMNLASSSDVSSASRPQQQQQYQKLQQGEGDKAATGVVGGDADEITAPGHLATPTATTTTAAAAAAAAVAVAAVAVAEIDNGDGEEVGLNDSAAAESPFLVFSPGMIHVRRQGGREGGYKESGLNCSTPTRPKHGSDWIGDLFSRGRLTRSRRTREDALVELDHDNVAQRRLQNDDEGEDEDEDEEEEDWEEALRGGGGGGSPVTPRSQFGRWKYSIMMSQSTMRPPKLSQEDDAVAVKRSANGEDEDDGGGDSEDEDDGGGDSEEDDDGDTRWPFGNADIGSDPSTPKRRPSKIPREFLMSPTSPSFRDSGCDDNDVDEEEEEEEEVEVVEEEEDDGTGADQDAHTTKDESLILKSLSGSQQDQDAGNGHTNDNDAGSSSSSTSAIGPGSGIKPPKLNLKHLGGGLPLSPSEISSSFHTPPRKRTRKDLDDFGTVGRPPPAPKLISPEQVLQFFSSSQSPSVLKSLQLRRMDGSFHKRSSNER